ncbi:MAG: Fibronectin type III domain protein [Thermotoga sp. 50_1627]|nr:MAG: Fibronectin type III domain protein [Thermotoga sp. 50_1627]
MHRLVLLLSCFVSLLVVSCVPLCDETGSLVVRVVLTKAIPNSEPTSGTVTLKKGTRILSRTFNFPDQDSVDFISIEKGNWTVSVELKDEQNHVIYVGQAQVEIFAGKQSTVQVPVVLNSADLTLNVSVASSDANVVELRMVYSQDTVVEQKNLEDGKATFEFRGLASAVWQANLIVYDQSGNEMLVWPEHGSAGLELQPGRMNTYSVNIDQFGNAEIVIEIDTVQTVSSAVLTNLDEGILISWDPVESAALYEIYKAEQDYWVKVHECTSTSYLDPDVVENAEYSYVFNVVDENGRHSGFSMPFTVIRDTQRIFVALSDESVVRFKMNQSQLTPVVLNVVSGASDAKILRAMGNDLYILTLGSLLRLNANDLNVLSSQSVLLYTGANSAFNDSYLFQVYSNELRRYSLSNFGTYETAPASGTVVDADRYTAVLNGQTIFVIDPETLQILITETVSGAQRVFTRGEFVFVYAQDTSQRFEVYSANSSNLELTKTYTVEGDVRRFDASEQFFCLGVYNKGIYIGRLQDETLTKISPSFPVSVKIVGNLLYTLFADRLELYAINFEPFSASLIGTYTFTQNALALFAD